MVPLPRISDSHNYLMASLQLACNRTRFIWTWPKLTVVFLSLRASNALIKTQVAYYSHLAMNCYDKRSSTKYTKDFTSGAELPKLCLVTSLFVTCWADTDGRGNVILLRRSWNWQISKCWNKWRGFHPPPIVCFNSRVRRRLLFSQVIGTGLYKYRGETIHRVAKRTLLGTKLTLPAALFQEVMLPRNAWLPRLWKYQLFLGQSM